MTEKQFNELIEAIENDTHYDWIANNSWNISKDALTSILLEFIWAYNQGIDKAELIDNIKERCSIY